MATMLPFGVSIIFSYLSSSPSTLPIGVSSGALAISGDSFASFSCEFRENLRLARSGATFR
eukprot:4785697-Prymnesium_polylepis.1